MPEWKQQQLERQARFWELIRKGATNTAACEAVGVERHQGYRWRTATGGRIPAPRFRLHLDGALIHLEMRAPAEAAALLAELLHRTQVGAR